LKIVFITSLFGDRGNNPAKFKRVEGCDYFLFSDRSQESFNTSWDVYNISNNSNISNLNCNIRKSRYAKFMGWELLNSMSLNYDCVYYCDVHWSPDFNLDWTKISQSFVSKEFPFAQDVHTDINVQRLGIREECNLIIRHRRDSSHNINKTINFFEANFPSVNLNASQYFENTMFGYNPNSNKVKCITSEFWDIYTSNDITFREQVLWNLLLLKNNLIPMHHLNIRSLFKKTGVYGDHIYIKK